MTDDRRFNLTQGEIPALFGEHPGGLTMADLRARKRGEVEDPDLASGRLFWEAHHAEWSARGVAEREGWVTQAMPRFVPHAHVSGLAAQLYRVIPRLADREGQGVMEVGLFLELTPTTPTWMLYRINAMLACLGNGWRWGVFAALCGNEHRVHFINRQVATIWRVEQAAEEFWSTISEDSDAREDDQVSSAQEAGRLVEAR